MVLINNNKSSSQSNYASLFQSRYFTNVIIVLLCLLIASMWYQIEHNPWDNVNDANSATRKWCGKVNEARKDLYSELKIEVPCETMPATAKSAIVTYLTAGKPDGKGSNIVFTGSDYINGVLALGASIQDHLTNKSDTHMLLLVNDGFPFPSKTVQDRLEKLGWIIGTAPHVPIESQYLPRFERYKTVYNKISAIGLAEYDCVLLLDADTLVIDNIDDLMTCQVFREHGTKQDKDEDNMQYHAAGVLDYYRRRWMHVNTGSILWNTSTKEMNRVFDLTRNSTFMQRFQSDQIFINTVYPDRDNIEINQKILKGEEDEENDWGSVIPLPWGYNAQTHVEYQLPEFWMEHLSEVKILHYTQRKGWQCPQNTTKPINNTLKYISDNDCGPDPNCACSEGYRWYQYLEKANQI